MNTRANCKSLLTVGIAIAIAFAVTQQSQAQTGGDNVSESEVCTEESCGGEYGTSLKFAKSPADAAKQAIEDEKLVFVLHVSGNFETPDYT